MSIQFVAGICVLWLRVKPRHESEQDVVFALKEVFGGIRKTLGSTRVAPELESVHADQTYYSCTLLTLSQHYRYLRMVFRRVSPSRANSSSNYMTFESIAKRRR